VAHIFEITSSPEKEVSLNPNGTGQVTFTVTNVTGAPVKARGVLGPEKSPALQWLNLVGEPERIIQPNMSDTFIVQAKVPPGTKPGDYSFRLDAISVARPDEDSTQGPSVGIPITFEAPPPKPFPWWILIAAAVGIAIIGYVALKLIPGNDVAVPDLTQKNVSAAEALLTAQHLKLGHVDNVVADGPKVNLILKQSLAPGSKAAPGSSVDVQVGAPKDSPVPDLSLKNLADGEALLSAQRLQIGTVDNVLTDASKIDLILKQSPAPPQRLPPNSKVDVQVGVAIVVVPRLKGPLQNAQQALKDAHLDLGELTSVNQPGQAPGQVLDSRPVEGNSVQSHSKIALTVQTGTVKVPDFTGQVLPAAQAILAANNLALGAVTGQPFRPTATQGTFPPQITVVPTTVSDWSSRGQSVPVGTAINLAFPGGYTVVNKSVLSSFATSNMVRSIDSRPGR
jgi:beta-lactam-binding protein with PASTA domain